MSDLYPLICEFAGGTYIAQLTAGSPRDAVTLWLGSSSARKYIPKESRVQLKKDLEDDPPVRIDECRNVWCCSTSSKRGLVLINLVLTAPNKNIDHKGR